MLTAEPQTTTSPRTARPLDWQRLLRLAAVVVALNAVLTQLAGRFVGPSLVVLTVLAVTGAVLVRRQPRVAASVLGVACALNLLLHGWVVGLVVTVPGAGLAVALSVVDLVGSLLAIVAAVAVLRRRAGTGPAAGRLAMGGAAVVVLATVTTFSLYATRATVDPAPGETVLLHQGLRVSPSSLSLTAEGGTATLVVRNDDPLYPRSFDIDALDLHLVIPPGTGQRVQLPPGEHDFYDFVTMSDSTSGTITVRP